MSTPQEQSPADGDDETAFERLLQWYYALPPRDFESSKQYDRYNELLPAALSKTLPPNSPESEEFARLTETWDDEFIDLIAAMDSDNEDDVASSLTSSEPVALTAGKSLDLSFLQHITSDVAALLQRARINWESSWQIDPTLTSRPGYFQILLSLTPLMQQSDMALPYSVAAMEAEGWQELARTTLQLAENAASPDTFEVYVQARRKSATICDLKINLLGAIDYSPLRISITIMADEPPIEQPLDAAGTAVFEDVAVADLDRLQITIKLPSS